MGYAFKSTTCLQCMLLQQKQPMGPMNMLGEKEVAILPWIKYKSGHASLSLGIMKS